MKTAKELGIDIQGEEHQEIIVPVESEDADLEEGFEDDLNVKLDDVDLVGSDEELDDDDDEEDL